MRIIKGKEILIAICISYTIINIGGSVFEAIVNQKSSLCTNNIMMLLWTSIAVFILSIHHLFDEWSPLAMILIQYIIALSLVFLTMLIGGVFEPVACLFILHHTVCNRCSSILYWSISKCA